MNIKLFTSGFAGLALLSFSLAGTALAQTPMPDPAQQQVAATEPTKPLAKKRKSKSGKHLSKATLSAFQPLHADAALKPAMPGDSAAAIALSPVVAKAELESLRDPPAAEARSGLALDIPVSGQAYFADEVSGAAKAEVFERDTEAAMDSDQLGAEPVSVIDRISDKPKGKPLANGPLRVKMKDSGLRASVQFPLSTQP